MTISLPSTLVKTAVVHTITYFIAGVLAYTTMNYEKAFADPALHGYMRATTERIVMAGPLFQPIRGLLFGLVFYLVRDSTFARTRGWITLWMILLIVGIIDTFGPAPGSIEGMIYTTLPVGRQILGLWETVLQTILFSFVTWYWVRNPNARWLTITLWVLFAVVMALPTLGLLATTARAGATSFAADQDFRDKALPRIATPEVLAIEMAKALVAEDRERITALSATREEMEALLESAQPPATSGDRQELKSRVAEILAERTADLERFRAMMKDSGARTGASVRFELIDLDRIYEKDGMKKIRHSHVRMIQTGAAGEESFVIKLDDMFLFPRGWAFTSIWPAIGKEPPKQ